MLHRSVQTGAASQNHAGAIRIRLFRYLALMVGLLWAAFLIAGCGKSRPSSRGSGTTAADGRTTQKDAAPKDSVEHERAVGRLLAKLQPGMTRRQVESIIGPADDPRDIESLDTDNRRIVIKTYYCRPTHVPEIPAGHSYAMQVVYDASGPGPVFMRIDGPAHEMNLPERP